MFRLFSLEQRINENNKTIPSVKGKSEEKGTGHREGTGLVEKKRYNQKLWIELSKK